MGIHRMMLLCLVSSLLIRLHLVSSCLSRGPPPPKTWINGDYLAGDVAFAIVHIDNDGVTYQQLKFLDSEDYAIQPIYFVGGEPVSAPTAPYPLRPGNLGKIAFLTGPPGSGKSTIAGLIAKKEKWVYYEGDGFFLGFNPYVFPNESQVEARSEKPALIGPGMSDRVAALAQFFINQDQIRKNETNNRRPTDHYYNLMAQDIKKERERVGGDWICAFAMNKRLDRDIFRKVIGEDLIFVVLDISLDLVKERLAGRGQGEEALAKEHYKYEPATEDEPNTVGFKIIKSRSKQENAEAVLDLINKKHESNIS